jgi:putative thioredoxin
MSCLIDVVRINRRLDDDGARRALLALFTLLGEQDPRTRKYRRALEQALF